MPKCPRCQNVEEWGEIIGFEKEEKPVYIYTYAKMLFTCKRCGNKFQDRGFLRKRKKPRKPGVYIKPAKGYPWIFDVTIVKNKRDR